jgi:hypothetical protein
MPDWLVDQISYVLDRLVYLGIQSHQCMEATPSLACANKVRPADFSSNYAQILTDFLLFYWFSVRFVGDHIPIRLELPGDGRRMMRNSWLRKA